MIFVVVALAGIVLAVVLTRSLGDWARLAFIAPGGIHPSRRVVGRSDGERQQGEVTEAQIATGQRPNLSGTRQTPADGRPTQARIAPILSLNLPNLSPHA